MARVNYGRDYSGVDRAADPGHFVQHLSTITAMDFVRDYKQRSIALLDLREGSHVLEIGCGMGDDARAMARLVGPGGRVVGIDCSATMVEDAQRRTAGEALPVAFEQGDAHALAFPDGTFDACRADRVLHHLDDPARAVAELARVAKPGGRVVAFEPDSETCVVAAADWATSRTLMHLHCDSYRHGRIGRYLPQLFQDAELTEIGVVPLTVLLRDYAQANTLFWLERTAAEATAGGAIAAAVADAWLAELRAASDRGRFFAAGTGFLVTSRKP